jgi:chromate transporter
VAGLHVTISSCACCLRFRYRPVCERSRCRVVASLKVVAAAVVVQAVWGMARSLCPDRERATIAILASIVTLAWPTAIGQLSSIAIAGIVGLIIFPEAAASSLSHIRFPIEKRTGIAAWIILFALLFGLPFLRQIAPSHGLEVFDSFFRVESLVFGRGHVVLPLLQTEARSWDLTPTDGRELCSLLWRFSFFPFC